MSAPPPELTRSPMRVRAWGLNAVAGMRVEDYYQNGKRWWFRLHEKGGKRHEVPAHHNPEAYMDAYLAAAGRAPGPDYREDISLCRAPWHGERQTSRHRHEPSPVRSPASRG